MKIRFLSLGLGLWILAGALHLWIAPQLTRLPSDYKDETHYAATSRYRDTPTGAWQDSDLIARRVDQALIASKKHIMIQGDLHWTDASGAVFFEVTGVYGVDRYTHENLPGYGDTSRHGAYLFPRHVESKNYIYWDQQFLGPRNAVFKRTEQVDGVLTYVFDFSVKGIDESAGFSQSPDVPERYRAHTDGQGTLWIEPTSGIVVDYEETGVSYFVEPSNGKRIADLYQWQTRFTPDTRASKLQQAENARFYINTMESWLPLGLIFGGVIYILIGWRQTRSAINASAIPGDA